MTHSRRHFLKTSAALAAASLTRPRHAFAANEYTPAPLSQFNYGDVELLPSPLLDQFQTNHAFYAALDEDSLLKPYRQRAGLPAPGEDMGGWYSWETTASRPATHSANIFPASRATTPQPAQKPRRKRSTAWSATSRRPSRPTSGPTTASPPTPTTKSPSA